MIPPNGCESKEVVWQILVRKYRLPDSTRLWQLTIEKRLFDFVFGDLYGPLQLFVRGANRTLQSALAKVVDELFIAARADHIH